MARVGEESTPSIPAPKALRPFLRFSRLPDRALDVARRVLDEDDDFRNRVADGIGDDTVGTAGLLFLTRPEGWEAEIEALRTAAADEHTATREEAEERSARRRLRGAEDAARRAESAVAELRAEMARLQDEFAAERKARKGVEEQLAAAQAAEAKALAEAGSSKAAADRARREKAELAEELAALEAPRTDVSSPEPAAPVETVETIEPVAMTDAVAAPSDSAGAAGPPEPVPLDGDVPDRQVSFDEAARAVGQAAAAAGQLGAALAAAAAALAPAISPSDLETAPSVDDAPTSDSEVQLPTSGRRSPSSAVGPRRTPAPLPPAVFDDSVEAAEHLVRVNGVIVLVDGYNLSKTRWPDLAINEQRQRLTNALGRLAARTGADIHAVFDGSEQPDVQQPTGPRRLVRVSFSPPTVEADDMILELVDSTPKHRPIVVASSDRRVQQGAASRGANVVSATQLLALLDR